MDRLLEPGYGQDFGGGWLSRGSIVDQDLVPCRVMGRAILRSPLVLDPFMVSQKQG